MLASYSAGIDLGGTFTKIALVSEAGTLLASRKLPAVVGRPPEVALAELHAELKRIAQETGLAYPPPNGCGIGIPGVVDHKKGWLAFSDPLGWKDVSLGDMSRILLGCEVSVDMDVNAGVLAELYLGCARESSDVLYIAWGTGIGAALALSRKVYHSVGGAMGNFGHMPADPSSARLCYCGCRGCLEIEAGGKGMTDEVSRRLASGTDSILRQQAFPITPERIAWAAKLQDSLAMEVLQRAGTLMARALAGVLALLNPDTVVIAGGVSRCFPIIQDTFESELRVRTPKFSLPLTRIVLSNFPENAGAVGAALLPLNR